MRPYVCPSCHEPLESDGGTLVCRSCGTTYPDEGGYYDFLGDAPTDGVVSLFDSVARVYETPVWYPTGMRLATGGQESADDLVERVADRVERADADTVVDVACGTGLFARRLAHDATVYGVDASAGMLRRAVHESRREGMPLELARADAASLPYADSWFDAATCAGALHLLPEPRAALAEMGRVVRSGGTLVLTTLVDDGPFGFAPVKASLRRAYGMDVFGRDELRDAVRAAGFEPTDSTRLSSLVVFEATRR